MLKLQGAWLYKVYISHMQCTCSHSYTSGLCSPQCTCPNPTIAARMLQCRQLRCSRVQISYQIPTTYGGGVLTLEHSLYVTLFGSQILFHYLQAVFTCLSHSSMPPSPCPLCVNLFTCCSVWTPPVERASCSDVSPFSVLVCFSHTQVTPHQVVLLPQQIHSQPVRTQWWTWTGLRSVTLQSAVHFAPFATQCHSCPVQDQEGASHELYIALICKLVFQNLILLMTLITMVHYHSDGRLLVTH